MKSAVKKAVGTSANENVTGYYDDVNNHALIETLLLFWVRNALESKQVARKFRILKNMQRGNTDRL
jgi:hypothetical protein